MTDYHAKEHKLVVEFGRIIREHADVLAKCEIAFREIVNVPLWDEHRCIEIANNALKELERARLRAAPPL
jgi:hypothetical protein